MTVFEGDGTAKKFFVSSGIVTINEDSSGKNQCWLLTNVITKKSKFPFFFFLLDISHDISHFTCLLTYFHVLGKKPVFWTPPPKKKEKKKEKKKKDIISSVT